MRFGVIIVVMMADRRQIHEYRGQQGEHQRLNGTDEELQDEEGPGQNRTRKLMTKSRIAPANIAPKRRKLNDRILAKSPISSSKTDRHINAAQWRLEERAEVEELGQIADAQRLETDCTES